MHEMQTIVTDVRGVCLSVVCHAVARAVYAAYRVRGIIWCSLCRMPSDSCFRRFSAFSLCSVGVLA